MLYIIYKWVASGVDVMTGIPLTNVWIVASEHSKEVDAQSQLNRFINSGIVSSQLQIVSDGSIPTIPPA